MKRCDLQEQIREMLQEGADGARERERTAFDELARPFEKSLVLFGAGAIGRKTAEGLRRAGIEPLAFADNSPSLWGKNVCGVPVIAPREAAARFGHSAVFVVTIWRGEGPERTRDRIRFLQTLGCARVTTFGPLYWKYADIFLPHYAAAPAHLVHEQTAAVLEAASFWDDEASREEYLAQLRWRLTFDFDAFHEPVRHPAYFPPDLYSLGTEDLFVDCGAFDGDTLRSMAGLPAFPRVMALEPDPANFERLRATAAALERGDVELRRAAAGERSEQVRFHSGNGLTSAMGQGDIEVECVTIDGALGGREPSLIKMDIEGAELAALKGASGAIREFAPILAISAYHQQDHLWNVPRLIDSIRPGYRFFLRPHMMEGWDVVCYAVPKHRLKRMPAAEESALRAEETCLI